MSKEKKLLIITIILATLVPICMFGLSYISESFLFLGMFCGISALFCGVILLDLKAGKKPKLIPIGICMILFSFFVLGATENFPWLNIPICALYAISGVFTLAKGIKDWHNARNSYKDKKPLNKKIYVGIGLLLGGFITAIVLFNINPVLMFIGHILVIVGFVFFGNGMAERNKSKVISPVGTNIVNNGYVKTEYCARCRKNITYLTADQIFVIDGKKYCADCNSAIEQDFKNQHTVCSVCGIDLPLENMHVIDNVLLCHECFLKKYGDFDSYDVDQVPSIDNAVNNLRTKIIEEISKTPADNYVLASLLWQDAANCFPKNGFQWDGAWFKLNLKTGKLFADVSTYPNQYGANYEDSFSLSASEFNRIAKKYNMNQELQAFKSEKDWAMLFDDNLKTSVSSACKILQQREEKRKDELRQKYAVVIPPNFTVITPNMDISEISIEIFQRYSSRSVKLLNENGKYHIDYVSSSTLSSRHKRYSRELSSAEAVWLENNVVKTINNSDSSTWQSLPGGDTMNIVIKLRNLKTVEHHGVKAIKKYFDFQNELEHLAEYGSQVQ